MKSTDVLTSFLTIGSLGSRVVCRPNLFGSWGISFPEENRSMVHIVRKGSCWFKHKSQDKAIQLNQGDLLFVAKVGGYALLDNPNTLAQNYVQVINHFANQQITDPNFTSLFCGSYQVEQNINLPFFNQLPDFILIPAEKSLQFVKLSHLLGLIIEEDQFDDVGYQIVQKRLLDILLIYIFRYWIQTDAGRTQGWLPAMGDVNIGQALSLLHNNPADKWNVEKLASQIGMSKTSFARKFSQLVGEPPMGYLSKWRIDVAAKLLIDSDKSAAQISSDVGYDSEYSFSRIFKKFKGLPPKQYRTTNRKL